MNQAEAAKRMQERLALHHLTPTALVVAGCVSYLALLAKWNARINLTALSLSEPLPEATIDKLIVEPLCAASLIPADITAWVDLGSGGGSPAVPLRLTHLDGTLTMVESRSRKCAFLNEVARLLPLPKTDVASLRFEQFTPTQKTQLITMRAVRLDEQTLNLVDKWLAPDGRLICFGASTADPRFVLADSRPLPDGSTVNVFLPSS